MSEPKTNFAMLLRLLGARPRDVCEAVGADKSLVSRWTNGKQKLMPGHGWVDKVADYLLMLDGRLKEPVLSEVLAAYYPEDVLDTPTLRKEALLGWLTTVGHLPVQHQPGENGLVGLMMAKAAQFAASKESLDPAPAQKKPNQPLPMRNAVVYGKAGVQGSALQFIDLIMQQTEPQDILYACPEGLDMYTRDEKFGAVLMDRMMEMFAAGHTLSVVLRTDYKMTDVSAFSGRWLVAHLLGYVKSYYFDEFHKSYDDKMMAVVEGRMAMKVADSKQGDDSGIYTAIYFDGPTVAEVWGECSDYRKRSKQRFRYHLFEQPDGYLRGVVPLPDRAHYRFARLPHFGLAGMDRAQEDFGLSAEERERLLEDFGPLFVPVAFFEAQAPVRHLYCENDIEDALLKSRHVCPELSTICGRRVIMATQALVDQLVLMKRALEEHKNLEVCFLPDNQFKRLTLQIVCWGDVVAIGWIDRGKSTACKDYTNTNALTGFCESVWDRIPGMLKGRSLAIRKINTWLKKAKKYGYAVNG
ncbi:hypothetical protein C1878_09705 [Gordonibacter sp. 28C]|uniref:hypothetical protein n=1 Tax=Gordonibacter sp. 28C TaxID=2078569 RepID=UPI000DF7C695|nr:hypothetical protein [Gordonibacter sp. 28C]RDB62066.1 hypothetical protein C1878_09705 [Gordonibacter sp. 28C]